MGDIISSSLIDATDQLMQGLIAIVVAALVCTLCLCSAANKQQRALLRLHAAQHQQQQQPH